MNAAQTDHASADVASSTGTLFLTGNVVRPLTLSLDDLRQYPGVTCAPFDLRCYTTNRFIRTVAPYRGVLLTDLLRQAELRCDADGDFKRMIFIAVGHDGYAVTFSWHELFNTLVGRQVVVAYECDGVPLDPDDGAPILFSGADLLPAPRHVKRLLRIETRVLRP
ncbi:MULTISPECIES: molybdopterin-dependent oxidoreductase [Burkholderiaceae]|uniref:molybdopterin-dependent oxidoreductase n=1 Tax=Burkholderiaceae TaxID=119060 RepID=UPI001423D6C6|nr:MULTISPECIES: molybdopterin-dependent oxidoreductase [Burkholderiaceae]MBN3846858.1 molybdopterin-dependent oxidoreductase [Paraburkholderia sp. Ac-20342]NIF53782.1 molybdopterin-dependent oxidoreductase [Burkholderia sp. Ax-1724]